MILLSNKREEIFLNAFSCYLAFPFVEPCALFSSICLVHLQKPSQNQVLIFVRKFKCGVGKDILSNLQRNHKSIIKQIVHKLVKISSINSSKNRS